MYLVFSRMFLFLYFCKCYFKIINILLELRALIFQFSLLRSQLRIHLLLILNPLCQFFDFGFQLNLGFNQQVTTFLSICQSVLLLVWHKEEDTNDCLAFFLPHLSLSLELVREPDTKQQTRVRKISYS